MVEIAEIPKRNIVDIAGDVQGRMAFSSMTD